MYEPSQFKPHAGRDQKGTVPESRGHQRHAFPLSVLIISFICSFLQQIAKWYVDAPCSWVGTPSWISWIHNREKHQIHSPCFVRSNLTKVFFFLREESSKIFQANLCVCENPKGNTIIWIKISVSPSQSRPVPPGGQLHLKLNDSSIQVAPSAQGLSRQLSVSTISLCVTFNLNEYCSLALT